MQKKFYYQPDIATSVTCWSYTAMILLASLLLWLEITVFQVWTVIAFVLFLLVAGIQILRRRLIINENKITIQAVIPLNNKEINLNELVAVKKKKQRILLETKYIKYTLLVRSKTQNNIYNILKSFV
ncbi:EbsA family protein [Ligilactobacillus sp. WILCCON 0076]|uniref:EbsA family protein n=1 Tax=Ligilactobacillus ubinensis TaxID=2876789 RepID=A0A9X2JLK9_9LACO|nr:EbsA family protein [Ligilactobacillus ubinensis]MCP0886171.1 EbsA family protein [Ligilactobacillus ubinensis]